MASNSPPSSLGIHTASLDLSARVNAIGEHYVAIGEYSDLWKGTLSWGPFKCWKSPVAVKVLRGGHGNNWEVFLENLKKRLNDHGLVWVKFNHPNVAKFYGLAFNCGRMPALVLRFYPNGNVNEYLLANKHLGDKRRLSLIAETARGLKYLHEFSPPVVHGDIRGSNILIDHKGHAVLADYGLVFIIESSSFTSVKTAGTCRWASPEVISPPEEVLESADPPPLFTKASDIWAFGMTVLEIITGEAPFKTKKNDSAVIFAILAKQRPKLPEYLTHQQPHLGELLAGCWEFDPQKRPSAATVCAALDDTPRSHNSRGTLFSRLIPALSLVGFFYFLIYTRYPRLGGLL